MHGERALPAWTRLGSPTEVLRLVASGQQTSAIAKTLGTSTDNVKSALAALRIYFNVEERGGLMLVATRLMGSDGEEPRCELSPQENAVLDLVLAGLADKAIAQRLGVKIGTVQTHLDRIQKKSGLRRREDLVRGYHRRLPKVDGVRPIPTTWRQVFDWDSPRIVRSRPEVSIEAGRAAAGRILEEMGAVTMRELRLRDTTRPQRGS